MKIRTGFVSNSSSSSYVVLLPEKDYKAILDEMSDFEKRVVQYLADESTEVLFGQEMRAISWVAGNYDSLEDFSYEREDEEGEEESAYDARDKFEELAEKAGAFTHSTDC